MVPRSPEGRASIVPPPPWHYSGDVLTIEYRTDPDRVAELLPDPLEPAEEDPGAVAVVFADWQSCSDSFEELLDPVRSQYKECFFVVRCRYRGTTYSRCVYIWVDKDFALARGWHQGYPKKLGMTRPVQVGKAGPRLGPGARFGATLAANDRRLVEARFEVTGPSERAGFVNAHPMLHHRFFPAIDTGAPPALPGRGVFGRGPGPAVCPVRARPLRVGTGLPAVVPPASGGRRAPGGRAPGLRTSSAPAGTCYTEGQPWHTADAGSRPPAPWGHPASRP